MKRAVNSPYELKTTDMKNLFIPYPLAVLAKEKGFKEKCIATYDVNKKIELHDYSIIGISILSAPLYQQIIDWFREKHDIDVYVKLIGRIKNINYYSAFVNNTIPIGCNEKKNYYDALDKAIELTLLIIK